MKLKQSPEDFLVEEVTDVAAGAQGPFAFYRLEKRSRTTLDALAVIRRRWRLDSRRISFGGLKDRHARTFQYFTVIGGPKRKLTHQGISVQYLGQLTSAFTSRDIRGNRFQLVVRDLDEQAVRDAQDALDGIRAQGVPNYFDDQRFGSVAPRGEFAAKQIVLGRFEEALRLALADPDEHDRAPQKRAKAFLRANWGAWTACRLRFADGDLRRVVDYLCAHAGDFRGALLRLPTVPRALLFSAYQSHLWNRTLARWLETRIAPDQLLSLPFKLGRLPMYQHLSPAHLTELLELRLPLPTARWHPAEGDPRAAVIEGVLREEGLELSQLKVRGVREMFFSKGERPALCLPKNLGAEAAPDELNPGRSKLTMSFELPPGSYATLIVKRATL